MRLGMSSMKLDTETFCYSSGCENAAGPHGISESSSNVTGRVCRRCAGLSLGGESEAMLEVAHRFPDHGMQVRSACLRPEPKAYPSDCK